MTKNRGKKMSLLSLLKWVRGNWEEIIVIKNHIQNYDMNVIKIILNYIGYILRWSNNFIKRLM